jgi:hypothetical protein
MRKLLSILICLGGMFVVGLAVRTPAYAAETTATYQGVLVKHTNTKYTHKLQNQNVNFILNSSYTQYEGKEVVVQVVFKADGTGFYVKSMVLAASTNTPSTTQKTFTGKLITTTKAPYTHVLENQQVNLILSSYYNQFVGYQVNVVVQFTGVGSKFKVVSITKV